MVARLKIFTFLTAAEIEQLEQAVADRAVPARGAEARWRCEVTTLVHGAEATDAAIAASAALFGQGDLAELDADTLGRRAGRAAAHARRRPDATVTQLLVDTGLTSSLGEARRAIGQGGVYLNNAKVDDDGDARGHRCSPAESPCCAAARRPSPASSRG